MNPRTKDTAASRLSSLKLVVLQYIYLGGGCPSRNVKRSLALSLEVDTDSTYDFLFYSKPQAPRATTEFTQESMLRDRSPLDRGSFRPSYENQTIYIYST